MTLANNAGIATKRPRSPFILAMLACAGIALFLAFMALGTWQVQRRAWKLDLIARVEQRLHAAPSALPPPAEWPRVDASGYEYRSVRVQGRWLADKTVLTQASTELGSGFWVLTPLQTADGIQVLVNRGFVPQRAAWPPPSDTGQVVGLLRMSEPGGGFLRHNAPAQQRWYSRDVAAIAQAQGLARSAPFFIDAGIPDPHPIALPENAASQGPWPRPGLTIVRFPNSHLVYALTWYGLALLTVVAGWLVARHERRLRQA